MNDYQHILEKLKGFTRKFYTNLLIKGLLLFLVLGVLFFLIILGVEYFLWLDSEWRLVLLVVFVSVELYLFYKYIVISGFYLFHIWRGIDNKQASIIIGQHFPEVGDKLLNLLDLAQDRGRSELLLASIEQRSQKMTLVPFDQAVDLKDNLRYVKYFAIPALIITAIWLSGSFGTFFGSYERVVNYNMAYEPPAPFSFNLLTRDLNVLETREYELKVVTAGKIKPEDMYIVIDGKQYLLQESKGVFSYVFSPPLSSIDFYFIANGIKSIPYRLNALKTPTIRDFQLGLHFPEYLHKAPEVLKSTGNATFPEGTTVKWQVKGENTDKVRWVTKDTVLSFNRIDETFEFSKSIYKDVAYQITTSNGNVNDYEKLDYRFMVIKDAYPSVKVTEIRDSLNPNLIYYSGEASDDYGVSTVRLVCFPLDSIASKIVIPIGKYNGSLERFYYTFPSGLELDQNKEYNYYFEVVDNDAIHGGKVTKSESFGGKLLNDNDVDDKKLEYQESVISNLDKSVQNYKKQNKTLNAINLEQKQKGSLSYGDQSQVKSFLEKQQRQESMMQKFSKQLKDNLKSGKDDEINALLKERLERQEQEARKNAVLLEELEKIAGKIKKEDLAEKLESLAKSQQSNERSLEQLLELTKRYYVTEKSAQLSRELESLSKEQDAASKENVKKSSSKNQEGLNENFSDLSKELNDLRNDNDNLRKPLDLGVVPSDESAVKKDQDDALKELRNQDSMKESSSNKGENGGKNEASKKQKAAADKMQQMSKDLGQSSAGGGGSSMAEDAKMLRQILDNILTFSFQQEDLYNKVQGFDESINLSTTMIRKEQELKELFGFVDDSLFALSLRRPELSEFVNERISDVYYNLDKALNSLSENDMYRGVSYQKYVLDASNDLADFLANILDNMEQSISKSGSGSGPGFQLPDIIQGQGELKDKLGQMGESGAGKKGDKGSAGEGGNEMGKGKKSGQEGSGNDGKVRSNGDAKGGSNEGEMESKGGSNEGEMQELYNIYKEQDRLRQELENQLNNMVDKEDRELGEKLSKLMQDFQDDLLENGITQQNVNKMNNIEYQLLKLQGAALRQGQKSERESRSNIRAFQNPITTKPPVLENYHDDLEILNRDALPLRQNYQNRVKDYFKSDD